MRQIDIIHVAALVAIGAVCFIVGLARGRKHAYASLGDTLEVYEETVTDAERTAACAKLECYRVNRRLREVERERDECLAVSRSFRKLAETIAEASEAERGFIRGAFEAAEEGRQS